MWRQMSSIYFKIMVFQKMERLWGWMMGRGRDVLPLFL